MQLSEKGQGRIVMFFGKSYWKTQEQAIQREWLLTNGIGGFAGSTITGMNARRYHGLLVASFMPPVERYLILSAISESVRLFEAAPSLIDAGQKKLLQSGIPTGLNEISSADRKKDQMLQPKTSDLSKKIQNFDQEKGKCDTGRLMQEVYLHSFRTPDYQGHGEHFLEAFHYDFIPEYHYRIGRMTLTKRVCLCYGKNQVAVVYRVKNQPDRRAVIRLTPLVNYRNYHYLSSHRDMAFTTQLNGSTMEIVSYDKNRKIYLDCSDGSPVLMDSCYFYNMDYPYEHERGLNGTEDHFIPGYYEIEILPGEEKTITFVCSAGEKISSVDGETMIDQEISRQKALLEKGRPGKSSGEDPFLDRLLLAVDKFIVYRKSTDAKTVIAGYPWFTDWGRDTMIALPGLTLATGRFDDAREILLTFARYEKDGLIPNVFPDGGGEPAYNTVDAALWYFEAVYCYLRYTGDLQFVKDHILPVLERIILGYKKGTAFQIGMQRDSLIAAGNEDTQLTWMDAKAGSWVVTPRHGKAVEINALWYNALRVMAEVVSRCGGDGSSYLKLAEKVRKSFVKAFWNDKANCLYDTVNEQGPDEKIRPNQILAVSLSFPVLEGEKAKNVVDTVHQQLYTALGLRTLAKDDPQYRGIYIGDQYARDGAYHQGTVWTWPLGRFITAYARVYRDAPDLKQQLDAFFKPFHDHLRDACIGSISEIFDGDEPLLPRGCCAQAWSVSEILRSYVEL